jgi:DNA anti-recombination protein RmuC
MQRMAWTDERLEERFDGIDRRFDEVDNRFEQVDKRFEQVDKRFEQVDKRFEQVDRRFEQVDRRFDRVEGEIVELRREMHAGFASLHSILNRTGAGVILGLIGVIGAIIAKGG